MIRRMRIKIKELIFRFLVCSLCLRCAMSKEKSFLKNLKTIKKFKDFKFYPITPYFDVEGEKLLPKVIEECKMVNKVQNKEELSDFKKFKNFLLGRQEKGEMGLIGSKSAGLSVFPKI